MRKGRAGMLGFQHAAVMRVGGRMPAGAGVGVAAKRIGLASVRSFEIEMVNLRVTPFKE